MTEDGESAPQFKVILIGSSGVGKTSLIRSLLDVPFSDESYTTVTPAMCTYKFNAPNGNPIEMQIWDTAGQEQYQSISQMFYRDSQVALLCFDAERKNREDIVRWQRSILEIVPKCKIILVLTKIDAVDMNERSKLVDDCNVLYSELGCLSLSLTSSKSGEGIKRLLSYIVSLYEPVQKVNVVNIKENDENVKKNKENKCC